MVVAGHFVAARSMEAFRRIEVQNRLGVLQRRALAAKEPFPKAGESHFAVPLAGEELVLKIFITGFVSLAIITLSAFSFVFPATAEEVLSDCSSVKVFVRTIKASDPLDERSMESLASEMEIDKQLEDLSTKLEKLPFRSFRLIASREEELGLRKKETLSLPNGQTLTFRPVFLNNKRVGISLDWKDSDGAGILNTRVHFDPEESLLTGTDSGSDLEGNGGLILAIRAVPIQSQKQDVVPAASTTQN